MKSRSGTCIAGALITGQSCCMSLLSWLTLLQICLGCWGLDVDSVAQQCQHLWQSALKSWFESKPSTTRACGGTNKNGLVSIVSVPFHVLRLQFPFFMAIKWGILQFEPQETKKCQLCSWKERQFALPRVSR